MNVYIEMAVDVVEVANQLQMRFDLRAAFVDQLLPQPAIEEITHTGVYRAVGKGGAGVDQPPKLVRIEHAAALAHHQMQSDIEVRTVLGQGGGLLAPRLGDHQAGAGQDSLAMASQYPRVGLRGGAEIVAVDNQMLQDFAISPTRRSPARLILLAIGPVTQAGSENPLR